MYTDKTKQLFNQIKYKDRRSQLRKTQTITEQIFWQKVRNKQLGVKFRRQHGIGEYIVDFYCAECSLIVEIDGDSHFTRDAREYDRERNALLQSRGFRVVRFTTRQVMEELESVLAMVNQICKP